MKFLATPLHIDLFVESICCTLYWYRVPTHLENPWSFMLDLEFLVYLRRFWHRIGNGCIAYKLICVYTKEWMVNVNDECLVFYIFRLRTMTESTWDNLKLDWKTPRLFSSKSGNPVVAISQSSRLGDRQEVAVPLPLPAGANPTVVLNVTRGVATGGISVYMPPPQKKISLPYKFCL